MIGIPLLFAPPPASAQAIDVPFDRWVDTVEPEMRAAFCTGPDAIVMGQADYSGTVDECLQDLSRFLEICTGPESVLGRPEAITSQQQGEGAARVLSECVVSSFLGGSRLAAFNALHTMGNHVVLEGGWDDLRWTVNRRKTLAVGETFDNSGDSAAELRMFCSTETGASVAGIMLQFETPPPPGEALTLTLPGLPEIRLGKQSREGRYDVSPLKPALDALVGADDNAVAYVFVGSDDAGVSASVIPLVGASGAVYSVLEACGALF